MAWVLVFFQKRFQFQPIYAWKRHFYSTVGLYTYLPNREPCRNRKSAIECHQAQDGEEKKAIVKASQQRAIANGFHTPFCHIGSMHSTHTHTHPYVFSKNSLSYLHWIDLTLFANSHTQAHAERDTIVPYIHIMSFSHSRQTPLCFLCVPLLVPAPHLSLPNRIRPQKICLLHSHRMPFRILFSPYKYLSIHVVQRLHTYIHVVLVITNFHHNSPSLSLSLPLFSSDSFGSLCWPTSKTYLLSQDCLHKFPHFAYRYKLKWLLCLEQEAEIHK